MNELRCFRGFSIDRSIEEFQQLLTIPDMVTLVSMSNNVPTSYCIIGKGKDMVSVVHEWGAQRPEELTFV